MVIVFDMDETMYSEHSFVLSGFKAVAHYLSKKYGIPLRTSYRQMLEQRKKGNKKTFDHLLHKYGQYSKKAVSECITYYYKHKPTIRLDGDAQRCLDRLNRLSIPLYIVTDGNKNIQHNKLKALGLYRRVKRCFITHRHGRNRAKPSPYCFLMICKAEHVAPAEVAYVADNPKKDFVGIKSLGFKTIRVLKGQHKSLQASPAYEAQYRIPSLDQLSAKLLQRIFKTDN